MRESLATLTEERQGRAFSTAAEDAVEVALSCYDQLQGIGRVLLVSLEVQSTGQLTLLVALVGSPPG